MTRVLLLGIVPMRAVIVRALTIATATRTTCGVVSFQVVRLLLRLRVLGTRIRVMAGATIPMCWATRSRSVASEPWTYKRFRVKKVFMLFLCFSTFLLRKRLFLCLCYHYSKKWAKILSWIIKLKFQ